MAEWLRETARDIRQLGSAVLLMLGDSSAIHGAAEGYWGEDRWQHIGLLMRNGISLEEAIKGADEMMEMPEDSSKHPGD